MLQYILILIDTRQHCTTRTVQSWSNLWTRDINRWHNATRHRAIDNCAELRSKIWDWRAKVALTSTKATWSVEKRRIKVFFKRRENSWLHHASSFIMHLRLALRRTGDMLLLPSSRGVLDQSRLHHWSIVRLGHSPSFLSLNPFLGTITLRDTRAIDRPVSKVH